MRIIDNLCEDETQVSLKQVLQKGLCLCSMDLFGVYIKFPRGENGNLSTFWLSYMDMIEILLAIIRASGEKETGCYPNHDIGHVLNYARYLPYYCAQMSQLPTSSPYVHAEFMQGGFLFQLDSNHPFGRIPVDQTIEETVNKDTQTPGGPRGSVWNQGL